MLDKLLPIWKAAQPDLLTGGKMDPYMRQMWNQGIRMMPGGGAATGALPLPPPMPGQGVVSGAPTQPPTPGRGGVPDRSTRPKFRSTPTDWKTMFVAKSCLGVTAALRP
jgi:hypothetical protein